MATLRITGRCTIIIVPLTVILVLVTFIFYFLFFYFLFILICFVWKRIIVLVNDNCRRRRFSVKCNTNTSPSSSKMKRLTSALEFRDYMPMYIGKRRKRSKRSEESRTRPVHKDRPIPKEIVLVITVFCLFLLSGDILFREGDEPQGVFFVLSGQCVMV